MGFKKLGIAIAVISIAAAGLIATADRTMRAQDRTEADSGKEIMQKLDDVLANQKTILGNLANIKEELNIVKIRITQRQ